MLDFLLGLGFFVLPRGEEAPRRKGVFFILPEEELLEQR